MGNGRTLAAAHLLKVDGLSMRKYRYKNAFWAKKTSNWKPEWAENKLRQELELILDQIENAFLPDSEFQVNFLENHFFSINYSIHCVGGIAEAYSGKSRIAKARSDEETQRRKENDWFWSQKARIYEFTKAWTWLQ